MFFSAKILLCSIKWQSMLTEIHFHLKTKLLHSETTFQVQRLKIDTKQKDYGQK